jgi:hypothetical protein
MIPSLSKHSSPLTEPLINPPSSYDFMKRMNPNFEATLPPFFHT